MVLNEIETKLCQTARRPLPTRSSVSLGARRTPPRANTEVAGHWGTTGICIGSARDRLRDLCLLRAAHSKAVGAGSKIPVRPAMQDSPVEIADSAGTAALRSDGAVRAMPGWRLLGLLFRSSLLTVEGDRQVGAANALHRRGGRLAVAVSVGVAGGVRSGSHVEVCGHCGFAGPGSQCLNVSRCQPV
jgi:hypothetical protein